MEVVGTLSQPGLVNLGAAVPPPELLPSLELHRALAGATRRQPALANVCDPSIGLRALRVEIAKRALEAGCTLAPDDIVITNGVTEALHLCLRALTKPGDIVAIESPTYFGILQIIEMLGLRACEIPTHPKEGVCLEELAGRLARTRIKACVFMTNFSNPLGSCLPDERSGGWLSCSPPRESRSSKTTFMAAWPLVPCARSVAKSFDHEGMVLLCNSMGKTLAPGYRVGWAVPGKFKAEVHRLKHTCSIGNPAVTQLALADFLATGGYERHLRRLRRAYAQLAERMSGSIASHFPAGTRVTRPQGGQVLWVEMPGNVDALELHRAALADGISIAPGPIFSARQQYRNCMRLNCANPWSERIEGALARLGALVNRLDTVRPSERRR